MQTLNTYITEKLRINDDTKLGKDWFQVDIADEIDMPDWAYEYRKLKNGSKNRLWYAVYCYLYINGPAKAKDVINVLKPGMSAYAGRFMTELRNHGVIRAGQGNDRGLQFAEEPDNWTNFVNNSYIC